MTDQQLVLDIPPIPFPYFWVIEIRSNAIYLIIQKRTLLWPFKRLHIDQKDSEYVGVPSNTQLSQAHLDQLSEKGYEMRTHLDPTRRLRKQFANVKVTQPVIVRRTSW